MEAVTDLDRLIERRSRQSGEQRPEEEAWAEGARRYNARRQRERAAEWYVYHADQAERLRRTMEALIAFHEARARLLEGEEC